jgi:hypothetical protein
MMGIKEPRFDPLPRTVSQEDLVPADDLYRRLEERVYLSLVRDLVEYRYAAVDRPSVDPVVFFQLQLILFRGPEERTAAHEDSGRPPLFALVVRLRPTRTASRALVIPPARASASVLPVFSGASSRRASAAASRRGWTAEFERDRKAYLARL